MFIVIEGLDGAGKSTQVAKIQKYLVDKGLEWEYLHFPRFSAPYYGPMIARFLRGELGAMEQVDPYVVAMLYAGDRAEAAEQIRSWIDRGKVVIVDRYVLSNIAYQCAKLTTEKDELKEWIMSFEYDHNKIPRPDLTLFLDVPFKFTTRSLTTERQGDDRSYLNGKVDIHEASLELQRSVRQMYITHSDPTYRVVNCATSDGEMASPDQIFEQIIDEIRNFI